MTDAEGAKPGRWSAVRPWIRRGFLLWAVFATAWMANSVRTQGVPDRVLEDGPAVALEDRDETLEFLPAEATGRAALIFICGAGISADAYAPLLRPIADAGYAVFVVKLPHRFAFFESSKQDAMARARSVMTANPGFTHWVISGHSLGGALASRVARSDPAGIASMVLIGTTHPKEDDLSSLRMRVTKVFASNDGVAPRDRVLANRRLLPPHTRMVEIDGGNHSQFGHYGHQLFDGTATITREAQQEATRAVLLEALAEASRTASGTAWTIVRFETLTAS